ncbi:MAG: tRNA lysidine(34) synthetase TilS [Clostridiales bacterium]|nr:tRNA lysidine(34) synthetase TilS [Clostridiales bacterium]
MKNEETAEILDKVLEFSKSKGLFDCGIIVVGLSGGPDSVALLHILKGLKNCFDIDCDIYALHCNHHLRPVVCDEEAELVRELCKENNVELKVLDFDCKAFSEQNRISEETAGRVLRYEAFEQYAKALEKATGKTVRVAIAHHKDDVAETMMMNLFRGAGLEGLVNPRPVAGRIIRPLLCLKKSELVDYLNTLGINYAVDQTNFTTEGTRNTWRNDILPKISESYGDPTVPLTRTYKLLSDDLDFISREAFEAYSAGRRLISDYPVLSVACIKDLHNAMKSRAVRSLWQETFGDLIDFEESNLNDCFDLIGSAPSGEVFLDMPFGRKAYRHGDVFAFGTTESIKSLALKIAEEMGFFVVGGPVNLEISLPETEDQDKNNAKIPHSLYILKTRIIENARELEYNNFSWFCPIEAFDEGRITAGNPGGIGTPLKMKRAGSSGSKELNRLLTDLKIPESARSHILFIQKDGEILWLPGFGHGIGFTNAVSYGKCIAERQSEGKPETFVRIAIERQ